MIGGPEELRRRRLPEDAARGDAPGRHGRARSPEAAGRRARRRHRPVGLDGACHCNTFNGGAGGGTGIGGVQKVDIGKEAILRAAAALTERDELGVVAFNEAAHWVVRTQPLGGIDDLQGQIAGHPAGRPDEHLRRPRPGGRVARGRHRHASPHHPADRRLVELRAVRRDPRPDEGGRDHALDGRCRWWLQPVPRGPRPAGRRPVLRRRQPVEHPGHLPQGDPAGLRASRSSRSRSSRSRPRRRRSCAASRTGCRSSAATTGRPSSRRPRACSSRPATIRSSPSGSTAWAAPWRGRRTRPVAGRRTGSAWERLQSVLQPARVAGRSRARRPGGIEATFESTAARRRSMSRASRADGSPRDFYVDERGRRRAGPRAADVDLVQVAPGRLRGAARRDRPGRVCRPGDPDPAGVVAARADGRAGRPDRRPSTGSLGANEPFLAALRARDRRERRSSRRSTRGDTT